MYKDRHARVEKVCEQCGSEFLARVERVNAGQGRFCSLRCFNLFQKENSKRLLGYENGVPYLNSQDGYYSVRWFSEDRKPHNTPFGKWWWTLNVGDVPKGHVVTYKDGNPLNTDPSNLECVPNQVVRDRANKKRIGIPRPDIAGKNNKWWRGGSSYEGYPHEFSKTLKRRIKMRDDYVCQCCYSEYPTHLLDVHHKDMNRKHNTSDNLVTVCKSCHKGIHGKSRKTNGRIEYYRSLLP